MVKLAEISWQRGHYCKLGYDYELIRELSTIMSDLDMLPALIDRIHLGISD